MIITLFFYIIDLYVENLKYGEAVMSIKKSLRLSLILLSALPIIFMTILIYIISYNKYMDLAKDSAAKLAEVYANGFSAQLDVQIAEAEGLAASTQIQNIALESYNGIVSGASPSHLSNVDELFEKKALYYTNYYMYDINGYLIASSDENANGDWEEYMSVPVSEISETIIMNSSNINKDGNSIEIIAPIKVKGTIVGIIRSNIPAEYFGAFMPEAGSAFILSSDGEYLFNYNNDDKDKKIYDEAKNILNQGTINGFLSTNISSVRNIYGYYRISSPNWLYVIKQDGSEYQAIISTLPLILIITLAIILIIAIIISSFLVKKYTDPIISLKNDMRQAADGDLDKRSDIKEENEFGELAEMFNNMMEIISGNYKELDKSKKILEENEIELKKNYAYIEQLAYHDGLTGLYNRVAFMKYSYDIFNQEGAQLKRHAIFFIDLDNFKNVNDTLGHDYGDLLLKQFSDQLKCLSNENDIVARTGGDEFLVFKSAYNNVDDLKSFAQSIVDIVKLPFDLEGEKAHVSASIGVALFPEHGLSINELIKNADLAMYSAKTSGKNAYRFFDSFMDYDFNRKNELDEMLTNVIEKKEVYLLYQPQVNMLSGEITGYEALMRINSELLGFVSPEEFIPIAEDNGMINELGEWALYEACMFNNTIIKNGYGPYKVSVNVSTSQLKKDNFIDIIKSIPAKTGMSLKYLEIEITESVLMQSFEHNLKLINQIKELGVAIALDDFGTGYSSFNYLTQLPIDTLKIDKSFIDDICNNENDKYIANTIISLAHQMNIAVVAEGVESQEQLEILQDQLCDTLQGYLFSKPITASELAKIITANKTLK